LFLKIFLNFLHPVNAANIDTGLIIPKIRISGAKRFPRLSRPEKVDSAETPLNHVPERLHESLSSGLIPPATDITKEKVEGAISQLKRIYIALKIEASYKL
jgi:hypothetical protein